MPFEEVELERPVDRSPAGRREPGVPVRSGFPSGGVIVWVALVAALVSGAGGLSRPAATGRPSRPTTVKVLPSPAPAVPRAPLFSNPTSITNPLLPISRLAQVVQLGAEGGDRLRIEMTLLPEVRTVEWEGRSLPTAVSQVVAYRDGRVVEVARDFSAQADDGAVWLFGEEAANYEDGVLVDREGSWMAGPDRRPVLVMPAHPQVGVVLRAPASPGRADVITVRSTDQVVDGPRGAVAGAMLVQERLVDGTVEDKTFAPGYGELQTRVHAEDEQSSVAVAVPTDAVAGSVPEVLLAIWGEALRIQQAWGGVTLPPEPAGSVVPPARSSQEWSGLAAATRRMSSDWARRGPGAAGGLLGAQMAEALADLGEATGARRTDGVNRAAVEVAHAALDLQVRHRPLDDVHRDRLRLWARQVVVDAAGGEAGAVKGDVVVLDAILARTPASADTVAVAAALADLRAAAEAGDLARAGTIAGSLAGR